jgi:hypothetical protein
MLSCGGAKIIPKNGKDGLNCTGTKIGGNVLLNAGFECKGRAFFNLARIGGDLDCCGGTFVGVDGWAIVATGAIVSGDVKLSSFRDEKKNLDLCFEAKASVWLVNADIGGSLDCSGASFKRKPAGVVLDFSRAKIKGDVGLNSPAKDKLFEAEGEVRLVSARIGADVNFGGASIRNENGQAINAQNAKVDGSFYFGGGFVAKGEVSLYGAEISKDLVFSGSTFENPNGFSINADKSSVSGNVLFQPAEDESCCYLFQSFGIVSLFGANCGAMDCSGGTFSNPNSVNKSDSVALDCSLMSVKGQVKLSHFRPRSFEAHGLVKFHTAQIGGHFDCVGGRFLNPQGVALDCQASKIVGCVFLRRGPYDHEEDPPVPANPPVTVYLNFIADGEVTFEGASIGSEFNCLGGHFGNANPHPLNEKYVGAALNLTAATIAGKLFLGVAKEETKNEPAAVVEGSVDLSAASVGIATDRAGRWWKDLPSAARQFYIRTARGRCRVQGQPKEEMAGAPAARASESRIPAAALRTAR